MSNFNVDSELVLRIIEFANRLGMVFIIIVLFAISAVFWDKSLFMLGMWYAVVMATYIYYVVDLKKLGDVILNHSEEKKQDN